MRYNHCNLHMYLSLTNHFPLLLWRLFLIVSLMVVASCSSQVNYAPVTEAWQQTKNAQGTHVVIAKDTLYSIAWRYGLDYRVLAKINHINPPYSLKLGQSLNLVDSNHSAAKAIQSVKKTEIANQSSQMKPASLPAPKIIKTETTTEKTVVSNDKTVVQDVKAPAKNVIGKQTIQWIWPTKGRIISQFSMTTGVNKGIDIAGKMGGPVKVAAPGRIVYAGNGLRGYGELIIVKHSDEFLSAYAHNRKILVKEGQLVKSGQVIAQIGSSEARQVMLHFEIRRAGVPVNPLEYLPSTVTEK
jgi:lipoprotein NlpD